MLKSADQSSLVSTSRASRESLWRAVPVPRFSHTRPYGADVVLHTLCPPPPPGITAIFSTTLAFYFSRVNLYVQNFVANFSLQIRRQTKFYSQAKKRKH